ncbi:glycine oxidase ThiO [Pseudomonas sp. CAU 1711]|uniref:glycine oxidase ThiO n=1 Tax=Pseudomonas sp. CAU 1711 TaxID=3140356 RepID=UPI00326186F4
MVGGGVMGLLGALELARAGEPVVVLERTVAGSESSWAGGGIVSPLYPWRYDAAVWALARWSQDYYPELASQLLAGTGVDPEVHASGLYWLDLPDEREALDWARRESRDVRRVALEEVREVVPALGGGFASAIYMPGVANVRNPRLLKALRATLRAMSNVTLLERSEVRGFLCEGGRVAGVTLESAEVRAARVVLAAGAWSGQLLAPLGLDLPVEPVKGQMILYKCAEDFLPAMVLARGRYAIPRKDGHILIGSTLEHAGFDKTPTEVALASLKASAEELLPALAEAEVVGHWAGLRPGSPEGIPFIGEVPQYPGLWLNCGHYRNGLVLAPASCELLKNLMLGEAPIVDPAPYAPAGRLG